MPSHLKKFSSMLLLMLSLLFNHLSYADNDNTGYLNGLTSSKESISLPKKIDQIKNQLSKSAGEVQQQIEEKAQTLKTSLVNSGDQLKARLLERTEKQYPLENRTFFTRQHYSFEDDVRPILNRKCIACHGCYDAPCQLKMESSLGLERGASKIQIYDGSRIDNLPPTRLGIDYQETAQWRKHGFYPIINGYQDNNNAASPSLMLNMLDLARKNSLPNNKKIPDDIELGLNRVNSCPTPDEFQDYSEQNPHGGMPLAFSGLTQSEYKVLSTWLNEGAKMSTKPVKLTHFQQSLLKRWEAWLNRKDNRSQLVSRYLYEHLFLAHLYFDDATALNRASTKPVFFKLIRSYNPPGQAAIAVKSTRPNDPLNKKFYYRLQIINETLVNKTHISYAFGEARLKQLQHLFFSTQWNVASLPGYSEAERGNPFITFKQIPATIRYRFLLEDASFFVRTFIRGPVCRGQIATDVIRDQFWIMFESPQYERYTHNKTYQNLVNPLLGVPGQNVSLTDFGSEWLHYHSNRNQYLEKRQQEYNNSYPNGAQYAHIWNGDHHNPSAFQTIFRHHDSASIVTAWQGAIPLTSWVMDYPLLERTIYELVVGFNVFGNVSHQAQTRLYFDLIRNEGETNFLRFMPAKARNSLYQHWYSGSGQIATLIKYHDLDTVTPSAIQFSTVSPYREFLQQLMQQNPTLTQAKDLINRCDQDCKELDNQTTESQINQSLRTLTSDTAKLIPGIKWLPNVSFLRVNIDPNHYLVYSLIRNRMHSNVAFMVGESLRLEQENDTLTILPNLVGSYPNLLFQVNLDQLNQFTNTLSQVNTERDFEQLISLWGVRRMNPYFWNIFHSFSDFMQKNKPLEAGIYDLNRYGRY